VFAFEPLDRLLRVPPDVADGHPSLLRALVGELDEVATALLRQGREGQPDHVAVVGRGEAEVGGQDGLLDGGQGGAVERLDQEQPRLRDGEGSELVQRDVGAVVLDVQSVEQLRVRSAGA